MADHFLLEFVLVRGPTALDRRLRVALPANGTPVTVGRAAHCSVLLDPTLLFSSQVHCSLVAMRAKAAAHTREASPSAGFATPTPLPDGSGDLRDASAVTADDAQRCAADAVLQTPQQQQQHRGRAGTGRNVCCVYVTDLCSSNGTFVNGVRISGTDPTPLHHGDLCIFGGMRDVEVGEALPEDAYDGPELVQWRVDLHTGGGEETDDGVFGFTATPLVLPARDTLAAEVHTLMATAQRSLGKPVAPASYLPLSTPTPTPGAASARASSLSGRLSGAHRGDSPHGVPQQLFTSPQTEERVKPHDAAQEEEEVDAEAQRSSSHPHTRPLLDTPLPDVAAGVASSAEDDGTAPVTAVVEERAARDGAAVPATPIELPEPVLYDVVRLGNVTFDARSPCSTAAAAVDVVVEDEHEAEAEADAEEGVAGVKRLRAASATSRTPSRCRPDRASRTESATPALAAAAVPGSMTALLTCTPSHLKWTMANPNDLLTQLQHQPCHGSFGDPALAVPVGGAPIRPPQRVFYGMLPVTSIATVVACPARRGLAVELRDGCVLPLVEAAVLSGSVESRWVVWTLSAVACPKEAAETAGATSSGRGAVKTAKGRGRKGHNAAVAAPDTNTASTVAEALSTPEARYEAWLAALTRYYGPLGVPAPVCVGGDAFDVLLAPPPPTTPTA